MFGLVPFSRKAADVAGNNELKGFRDIFDDFFSDSFLPTFFSGSSQIRADVRETDNEYIIEAELPGVEKENIKVDLRDDTLTIGVERNEETKDERKDYIRRERRYGSYCRSFYVDNVKHDSISAKYNDGILSVILPKEKEEKNKKREIPIQ
jgi:HSP20 family protein